MYMGGNALFDDTARPAKRFKVDVPTNDIDVSTAGSLSPPPCQPLRQPLRQPLPLPLPRQAPPATAGLGATLLPLEPQPSTQPALVSYPTHPPDQSWQPLGLLSQPLHQPEQVIPAGGSISMVAAVAAADPYASSLFDASWQWPSSSSAVSPSTSQMALALGPSPGDLHVDSAPFFHTSPKPVDPVSMSSDIRNWCPGRSVLLETNLWLKDFAQMHKSDGGRAAIQSLAGIYIYDYQPIDSIRRRVNQRFLEAERRFSQLLNDTGTAHREADANELITMAVILSMQDIVLTERRLRKPYAPRWLSGFKQGELFLQAIDHGSRFWKRSNAQFSSLRISQSIIVGRAMILSQPMMQLPSPDTFDPEYETSRFGWLLYGTEQDMYQIHGGCGFSKKLLHLLSQITYCAARLQQDPENIVVPTTSQYLHAELLQMRQWSSESKDWDNAKAGPSVTEWVRSAPDGFIISSSCDMTDVTAESWRLTAILYLQCRVLRLPRNHPAVVKNLTDLARCIRIMPTSGYQFTEQAPLFPVFLLGMLATVPDHRQVSKDWFDDVVSTPVRSSVPPLYEVLQRIWQWIDTEIQMPDPTTAELAAHIGMRHAWWEQLVKEIDKREVEVLCLT